jgi:predicted DCC family thiol-disulfide oxidoreductase YuxK
MNNDSIIFFDGICIQCNKFISILNKFDTKNKLLYCDLNCSKAKQILDQKLIKIDFSTLIFYKDFKIFTKSSAIIEILATINPIFKIGYIIPIYIRDYFYNLFSRNRFLFGKNQNVCVYDSKLLDKIIS